MTSWVRIWLAAVCCVLVCHPSLAEDNAGDEQMLRAAGIATDETSLLDFFRKQTADEASLPRARALIKQLGSDEFTEREQASRDLRALGPWVLPLLRQTVEQTRDPEVRRRARDAIDQLQLAWPVARTAAAVRLLARRHVATGAETLLAFLPGPYDDGVREEIVNALVAISRANGVVNPCFVRTLASREPARRTAAAVVLCRLGVRDYWPAVRKLLHDREAGVRLPVAMELAGAGDRQAVPVLIDLLAELPVEQAGQAEELLYRLAGPQAPPVPLGQGSAEQRRCRDAWRGWWREHGQHVEMTALHDQQRQLGYTLLVLLGENRVVEWDRDGKLRWQITGLSSPLDAEVLANGRVLIAEHDAKRVTERNLQSEILWEQKLRESPIHAQRLAGGVTFIATRKQLVEIDASGRTVIRYRSPSDLITARRYRDGRIAAIEKGWYFELNARGEEVRRFAAPPGVCTTNALTLLPNGHLLIASYGGGTVQEYDRAGKIVWQIKLGRPLCAVRLPSGNTLVSSQDMVLLEYDRGGKEIARRSAAGHPCQIRRR